MAYSNRQGERLMPRQAAVADIVDGSYKRGPRPSTSRAVWCLELVTVAIMLTI
jgi:hypothetical protein